MELILNEYPRFTKKHLDFLKKYEDSYGLIINQEEYRRELENINNGNPSPRNNNCSKCYEIYDDNAYIGDIIVHERYDVYKNGIFVDNIFGNEEKEEYDNEKYTFNKKNEIDIAIFDDYKEQGYAYNAIKMLLDEYGKDELCFQALIREENKQKERVERILNKVGFKYKTYTLPNGKLKTYIWEFNR
ncbi:MULTISPECIES: N-acetyltransferase [unclassified Clostridioides]|uniref:N-acetyltransferase n=1 Tax=unclassified Clostridioides TaxID=2635829 RepID=UPI001D0FA2C7|nr:N-acetyltransferase [Clostridioides sp. ES-S-0049-03]MCC0678470.1 N-acetyltransferase [Clostridioides sp. ES-W-0018-02]MCC0713313.1 N-acetyltransferase [Clostridioides sp. ES-W-0017-02]